MMPHTARDGDLLAAVTIPEGVSASPWGTDVNGHLVRELSDGRIQRGNGDVVTQCKSCSVNTRATLERLGGAVAIIDRLRRDVNAVLRSLPGNGPLFASVDIVTALGHLRQASLLMDTAADALEADARD